MPRKSRIDAPGVLHHVIIRGVEQKNIFRDKADRQDFVDRLSRLAPETQTACYAWVLMGNHAHFLFRSGPDGIARLMRRLLTGYAVSFNHRHSRHGQLFQNRYKSVICQENTYLKQLVRYIHLNPLRAQMVQNLDALALYEFCGHGVLLGQHLCPFQDDGYILNYFGKTLETARRQYIDFVVAGADQGRRPELVGGGLVRSLGGWTQAARLRQKGMARIKSDQRILGDSTFVRSVLDQAGEAFERRYALKRQGYDLASVAGRAASLFGISAEEIYAGGRQKPRAAARALFCYWAARELGVAQTDLAQRLRMTPSGVGYAVQRGEALAVANNYRLLEEVS